MSIEIKFSIVSKGIQYALMREHTAMEQYTSLAQNTQEGPIQNLFLFLANEETKHKNDLEKLYYEVIHSGGVNAPE